MIVKFLKASADFPGVYYNMDKIGTGSAEMMAAVNFDALVRTKRNQTNRLSELPAGHIVQQQGDQ
jgi:hypothetical protein